MRKPEGLMKQTIAIAEKIEKSKSANRLRFLSNLALLYQQMNKYNEAEAIYLGMEKRLGKSNPDYASMLNNQAALYMVMGKQDKVEELLKKSAEIYKSNFGEENVAYARSISDLGNFYRIKERYSEADPLLKKALTIREATLGRTTPCMFTRRKIWQFLIGSGNRGKMLLVNTNRSWKNLLDSSKAIFLQ